MKQRQGDPQHSFFLSGFILSVSLITVKIIGALFKIPLMNLLSETGMAYFTGAYTVFTAIYAVTVSGLTGASAKVISAYRAAGLMGNIRRLKTLSLLLYGGIGLCGTVTMLLGADRFSETIGCKPAAPAIMTSSFAVLFCCLMAVYRGYYEGSCDMRPTAISQVIEAVGKLVFGLYGVYAVFSYAKKSFVQGKPVFAQKADTLADAVSIATPYAAAAALLGISLSTLCGLICLLILHRCDKTVLVRDKRTDSDRAILKELFCAAFPITVSTAMLQLIPLIDTLTVIRRMERYFSAVPQAVKQYAAIGSGEQEASVFCFGIFSACTTLFHLIPTAASLISKIVLPTASGYHAAGEHTKQKQYIQTVLLVTALITTPAAFGMAAVSKPILRVLYASQPYTAEYGERVLQILGAAAAFSGLIMPLCAFLQAAKSFWSPVVCQLLGAGCKYIGNLFLIPRYGIEGAAYATLLGYGVTAAAMLIVTLRRYGGIFPLFGIGKVLLLSTASGMIAGYCSAYLEQRMLSRPITLGICVMAAVLFYIFGGYFLRILPKNAIKMLSAKEKT